MQLRKVEVVMLVAGLMLARISKAGPDGLTSKLISRKSEAP